MIRTLALIKGQGFVKDLPLASLSGPDVAWYWVDFNQPDEHEARLLSDHFHFHPLAIEDCYHFLQRPKMDYYDGYQFFVLHALYPMTLHAEEIDLFLGRNYVVSFHLMALREVEEVWSRITQDKKAKERGPLFVVYQIMDKLVDNYFPMVYQIEDHLDAIEDNTNRQSVSALMDQVFDIRSDLLKIRRTVVPMRDLLYRILNSTHIQEHKLHQAYFTDIHDHLLKLAEMIESNREMTADLRDSYLSINSNRMNSVMMTLTMITTIFMPLTLIAGIYGMNFENMPELTTRYGYYVVLGVMLTAGGLMYLWFRRKGWFDEPRK